MKKWWLVRLIGGLFIALGIWLIFGQKLPGVTGSGSHSLDGWEKLGALLPIGLGVLILIGSYPIKKGDG